jgi:propanol-preferring alcohol dehydrogenase
VKAWQVGTPAPVAKRPLELVEREPPVPGSNEVLVRVIACGVCRTDLHIAEGDLPPHRDHVVPGHEVVGVVDEAGDGATRFPVGTRVGIAWLRHTCGECMHCRRGDENLCVAPGFTGWDADGGYAEYACVHEDYAYAIPDSFNDATAAPLLCAGIIGYRALQRAHVPEEGALGIYGFGGSAHIAAQVALYRGARVHVMTRSENARRLALELGCHSAADTIDTPPEPLDSAIVFAPAGEIIPAALQAVGWGGRVAIAGIHLSDIPTLDYERHLFHEKELVSVAANTRADGKEFLEVAAQIPVKVSVTTFPLDRAPDALIALAEDRINGAAVLLPGPSTHEVEA